MKRILLLLMVAAGFLFSASMSGCYYDVEEELYGSCDTSSVTYSGTIKPLLTSYGCYGCHTGTSASGGVNLDTHHDLVTQMNKVWIAINHTGTKPMPQGGSKMNACDINKVKAWMDQGTPEN